MKRIFIPLLFLFLCSASSAQEIKNVSFESGANTDTVVIEMSSPADPKIWELKEPDRVVIDLRGGVWGPGMKQLEVDNDRVKYVRWAQNTTDPANFRVVLETKKTLDRKVETLDGGNRIVIRFKENGKEFDPQPEPKVPVEAADERREEIGPAYDKEITPSANIALPKFSKIKKFNILVNGKKLEKTYFSGNVLMAPAKEFFGLCDFETISVDKERSVTLRYKDRIEVRIVPGSNTMTVNGVDRQLTVPVKKRLGKLYIPLVSAVKWMGLGAVWEKEAKTLYVAPRITRIAWEERDGAKSVIIDSDTGISTYEVEEKEDPMVYIVKVPGRILDTGWTKLPIKEEEIKGVKLFQSGDTAKIGIYLYSTQASKVSVEDGLMAVSFPPTVISIGFTEEADSIRIDVICTKPVKFDIKKLSDPERLIIDIPNTIFKAGKFTEVNKGAVLRLRASQFKLDPLQSRVVIDLAREASYNKAVSIDDKFLALRIQKQEVKVEKAKKIKVLKDKVIVIDPGHGGPDPGAFGYSGDKAKEKDINLSTALKLARLLSDAGADVQLTREEDMERSLQNRVDFSKNNNADVMVSVHYNSSDRPNITGTETYYFNDNSKLLGKIIHKSMVSALRRTDRGLSKVRYFVIYHSPMPSVLVEPVYINDREEEILAKDAGFQKKVAESIFEGIKEYFEVLRKIG